MKHGSLRDRNCDPDVRWAAKGLLLSLPPFRLSRTCWNPGPPRRPLLSPNRRGQGDLRGVTQGLSLLRRVGLEDVARRTALELMLLERRG